MRQDLLRDAKLGSPPHKLLHSLLHGTPRPLKGEVEHAGRNRGFGDIIAMREMRERNGSEEIDTLAINWGSETRLLHWNKHKRISEKGTKTVLDG